MHTALAYWQGGRPEEAFKLWKGSLVESMYVGASPGNFQQLSFYDAIRGELYRDFADDIGMTARSLVEGLFGVFVDALHDTIHIHPGFPSKWNHASISTPDLSYDFKRTGKTDQYHFSLKQVRKLNLSMHVGTDWDDVQSVFVNGKSVKWKFVDAIEKPAIVFNATATKDFVIKIKWKGRKIVEPKLQYQRDKLIDHKFILSSSVASFITSFDPQEMFLRPKVNSHEFSGFPTYRDGPQTFFLKIKQGGASYWYPLSFDVVEVAEPTHTETIVGFFDKIDLTPYFNDRVTNIFKNQYLSPRPNGPTLQLPTQGIGNWAYPLAMANINDSGLRQKAGYRNEIVVGDARIPFATPSSFNEKNILFTSMWDNYPDSAIIPLTGNALSVYFLMAGSTNPMQSRMVNGALIVRYKDGTQKKLELKNPENWWPIEQDVYDDGFAFTTNAPRPLRVYFKTGEDSKTFNNYITIRGFTNRAIDGGAGTVLYLSLDPSKELQSLVVKAIANDVVIGLMSVTQER